MRFEEKFGEEFFKGWELAMNDYRYHVECKDCGLDATSSPLPILLAKMAVDYFQEHKKVISVCPECHGQLETTLVKTPKEL